MAGKQEHKPGVVIDYKNKLDDRFVDLTTQKTTSEANNYLTQFNTNLHSENTQTVGSVSPYFYHSNARPGAKSPMSVEMAQHIFRNTLNSLEDALRAEIARAFSSEKYLSDFMKENMVTKSEDQTISGFKKFDSVQVDHADIDTEFVDEAGINEEQVNLSKISVLNVLDKLRLPFGIRDNPVEGQIWYETTASVGGSTGEASSSIQARLVKFENNDDSVSLYDGSRLVGQLYSKSKSDKIQLDGSKVLIPCGVLLDNFIEADDSIELIKDDQIDSLSIKIKDNYIEQKINDTVSFNLKNEECSLQLERSSDRNYELSLPKINLGCWNDNDEIGIPEFTVRHGDGVPFSTDFNTEFALGIDTSKRKFGPGNNGKSLLMKVGDEIYNVCHGYIEDDILNYTVPILIDENDNRVIDFDRGVYQYTISYEKNFYGLVAGLYQEVEDHGAYNLIKIQHTEIDPKNKVFERSELAEDEDNLIRPIEIASVKPAFIDEIANSISSLNERLESSINSFGERLEPIENSINSLNERLESIENQLFIDQGSWS